MTSSLVAIHNPIQYISSISSNTIKKTVYIGLASDCIFGSSIAVTSMVANLAMSYLIPPAENNTWFNTKYAFKQLTCKDMKSFYKMIAIRTAIMLILPAFFGINPFGAQHVMKFVSDALKTSNYQILLYWIAKICVIAPVTEEIFFRGFIQEKISDIQVCLKGKQALTIQTDICNRVNLQAILFGLAHYSPKNSCNVFIVLVTGLIGRFLGEVKENTKDLWAPIGMHASHNSGITASLIGTEKILSLRA